MKNFAERVDVVWGTAPDGQNSDLLVLLCPHVGPGGRFFHEHEKCYPLSRLLNNSEVRRGKTRVVLITSPWAWQDYLRRMVERAERSAQGAA